MPMITKIETNLKSNEPLTIELTNPHIAIVGKNASGKTALVNAITLPLFGDASDLGARDKARDGGLLQYLLPAGATKGYSRLTFSDGSTASWEMTPGKRPSHSPPPFQVTAPMESALDVLKAGRDNVVRYFMREWGPDEYSKAPDWGIYATYKPDLPFWERVLAVEAKAAATSRAFTSTANAVKKAAGEMGVDMDDESSDHPLVGLYHESKAQADAHKEVAQRVLKAIHAWFTAYRPTLEATLRADTALADIGFLVTKKNIFIGRRDWTAGQGRVLPFTSGAETILVALKLAAHSRARGGGLSLCQLPDKDYDMATLAKVFGFGEMTEHTMVYQGTRLPHAEYPGWEVIRVK